MSKEDSTEQLLHYTMSVVGGFLGGYAILNRSDMLGAAQTSNMIHTVLNLAGGNLTGLAVRLLALFLYVSGIMAAALIPRYTRWNLYRVSLAVDAAAVLVLGFLPQDMNNMVALYPLFFAMSFQWCTFQGCRGYASATVFSTNNLRQFTTAAMSFILGHETQMKDKMKFYGMTLVCFHMGVAAAWPAYRLAGVKSAWLCYLPLAGAAFLAVWGSKTLHICTLAGGISTGLKSVGNRAV